MIKSSFSSRRNTVRFFNYVFCVVFVGISAVNLTASLILQRAFRLAVRQLLVTTETSLSAHQVSFNLLRGATISGIELRKNEEVLFASRRLDIGIDVLSLFRKQVKIKNLRFFKPFVSMEKFSETARVLQRVSETSSAGKGAYVGMYETLFFQLKNMSLGRAVTGDLSGYLTFIKGDLLVSRGTLTIKQIKFPAIPNADFFEGSHFYKPFDYVFEASARDRDIAVSRFELSNPRLKFNGSGSILGSGETPRLDIEIDFPNILLEDFPALNQLQVRSHGVLDGVFKVTGPFEKLRTTLGLHLSRGDFMLFNSLSVTKVKGDALMTPERFFGQNFSLDLNGMPLLADFAIYPQDNLHLLLRLTSLYKESDQPAFDWFMSGDWRKEGYLAGEARGAFRYSAQQALNTLSLRLWDFRLGYDEDVFLYARLLNLGLVTESGSGKDRREVFDRKVALEHLFGIVQATEDGLVFDHIKCVCYDGTLEGKVNLSSEEDVLGVKGEVHLRDVSLRKYALTSPSNTSLSQGKLDGDLRFDNNLSDQLKGQIFIVNGEIEKNPILDSVANFLNVTSLKKVSFGDLSAFFNGGRGNYSVQVKLTSSLVNGSLEGKVADYDKMDGYLSVSLATQLLNESSNFKKILTYIKHDQPSVAFSFKISSYVNSPRILWLKNEFKDKLQNLLPERNKRYLQAQLNGMVEKMEVE